MGADYLHVTPIGSARTLNPSPDPTWGLHLADVNLPLEALLADVASEARAYTTAPKVRLACAAGRVRVTAKGPGVARLEVRAGARRLALDRRAPLKATVTATGRLRVSVTRADGRVTTVRRGAPACA